MPMVLAPASSTPAARDREAVTLSGWRQASMASWPQYSTVQYSTAQYSTVPYSTWSHSIQLSPHTQDLNHTYHGHRWSYVTWTQHTSGDLLLTSSSLLMSLAWGVSRQPSTSFLQRRGTKVYLQYSTVQYSTVQYSTVQYSTVQYSTVQYSTV